MGLLDLPIELFRMILQGMVLVPQQSRPDRLNHLRLVCKLFNQELTDAIRKTQLKGGDFRPFLSMNQTQKVECLFGNALDAHTQDIEFTIIVHKTIDYLLAADVQLLASHREQYIHDLCQAAVNHFGKPKSVSLLLGKSDDYGQDPTLENWDIKNHVAAAAAYLGCHLYFERLWLCDRGFFHESAYFGFPIWCAARQGHVEMTRLLLENLADGKGEMSRRLRDKSLLHASRGGNTDVVKLFLDRMPQSSKRDILVDEAVLVAAQGGYVELTSFLIQQRNVDFESGWNTPEILDKFTRDHYSKILVEGAHNGHQAIVNFALLNGADPSYKGYGRTTACIMQAPLVLACLRGHIKVVELLLENGADQTIRPWKKRKESPLHVAARRGYNRIVKLLVENGAPKDYYPSALCGAAYCGQADMVEFLLKELGSDISVQACQEALERATEQGYESIVHILTDHMQSLAACTKE